MTNILGKPNVASPTDDDAVYVVNDADGTPTDGYSTLGQLASSAPFSSRYAGGSALIADAVETTATVAPGSTSCVVAGVSFVSGDVGKVISLTRYRYVDDANITIGDNTLTSATAVFAAEDVGAIVNVSKAGATSYTLDTTIASVTSGTEVETVGAAGTTAVNQTAMVAAIHTTTIASVTPGTGNCVLTAGPTPGFTASSCVIGTDQRATFASESAAAVAAKAEWVLPGGKILVVLTAANPWAMASHAGDLAVRGQGKDQTKVVVVNDVRPSAQQGVFRVTTSRKIEVSDLTIQGYLFSTPSDAGPNGILYGGGAGCEARISRVDVLGMIHGITQQSGATGDGRRMILEDCDIVVHHGPIACFADPNPLINDFEFHATRCLFKSLTWMKSLVNDSAYNRHVTYVHPCVSISWIDVTTDAPAPSTGFHIHHYGGPDQACKFYNLTNCRFLGGGQIAGYIKLCEQTAVLTNCHFEGTFGGFGAYTDVAFVGGFADIPSPLVAPSVNGIRMSMMDFTMINAGPGWAAMGIATSTYDDLVVDMEGGYFETPGSPAITVGGDRNVVSVRNVHMKYVGAQGDRWMLYIAGGAGGRNRVTIEGCTFDQGANDPYGGVIEVASATNDVTVRDCVSNLPDNPILRAVAATGTDGAIVASGNVFPAGIAASPVSQGQLGNRVTPLNGKSPTALTVAANYISPPWTHDVFDCGAGTINNIYTGGAVSTERVRAGDLTLIATGALTLAHNAGGTGNLRMIGAGDKVMSAGQVVTLRKDTIANLWYETGAGSGSGIAGVRIEDEGSTTVASATGVNFAGAGVVVTDAGANEALVTISGATGTIDAGALGLIDFTNPTYGGVCDGRSVSDGVTVATDATVTSATAAFVAGDVGKTINISVPDRVVADAAIGAGDNTLTSATAAFTADDVGKTVHIDSAAAANGALITTIASYTSATEVEVTAAATNTVTGKVLLIRTPPHQTTIASRNSATSIELTSTATWTLTGATLCLGTENRVAFAAAVAAAVAARKPLYIPPGTGFAMISLNETNEAASAVLSGSLRMFGAGAAQSRIVVVVSEMITTGYKILLTAAGGAITTRTDIEDITIDYIGPGPQHLDYGPFIVVTQGSTDNNETFVRRVRSTGFPRGLGVNAGTGTGRRNLTIEDTTLSCLGNAVLVYTPNAAIGVPYDSMLYIRNCDIRSTATRFNDPGSGYDQFVILVARSTSVDIDGLTTYNANQKSGCFHIGMNSGGSADQVMFWQVRNWLMQGTTLGGFGLQMQANLAGATPSTDIYALLERCDFNNLRGAIGNSSNQPLDIRNCNFRVRELVIVGDTAAATNRRFERCTFNDNLMQSGQTLIQAGGVGAVWEFVDCIWQLTNANTNFALLQSTSQASDVIIRNNYISSAANIGFWTGANGNLLVEGCTFTGHSGDGFFSPTGLTDNETNIVLNNNIFRHTTGGVFLSNTAWAHGNLRGQGNIVPSNTLGFQCSASGSGALTPPQRKSDTAVVSAAQLDLTWNHDSFDISGTTTINNIYVGGSANNNRLRGGDLFLTATGAWKIAHNASGTGNIRLIGGQNKTAVVGQMFHFRADEKNGIWYEVGDSALPAIVANTAITAVSGTIRCDAQTVTLTADNSYTLTSAPTIADGVDGQRLTIINVDDTDTITIQDQGTLASSNLRLTATTVALGPRDSIELTYSATVGDWVQTGAIVTVI